MRLILEITENYKKNIFFLHELDTLFEKMIYNGGKQVSLPPVMGDKSARNIQAYIDYIPKKRKTVDTR